MSDNDFLNLSRFVKKKCKYKKHWCDGIHISYYENESDKLPCEYYVSGACNNPNNPKTHKTN